MTHLALFVWVIISAMFKTLKVLMITLVLFLFSLTAFAAEEEKKTFSEMVASSKKLDGWVPLYLDESSGKLFMEIDRFDHEMLWQVSLATGVGSTPLFLDRGRLSATHLVTFKRVGSKVLLIERNTRYRAKSDDPLEREAVEESFAPSVQWGFKVEAEEKGRVLIDATDFFMTDWNDLSGTLRDAEQGSYSVDEARSTIWTDATKGFPKNTEVEVLLTVTTSGKPGREIGRVTPSGKAVTVRQHHSFVQLPPLGFELRRFDPRTGAFSMVHYDYASPIDGPLETRLVARHRLIKKDPSAAVSAPVEPIVYYIDSGAPEPIRQALIDGAAWWNDAFAAAGFTDAFQVRTLPPDVDPMDLRYNVVHWTHRSTRGWSYGDSVVDPRTGEILKGNVNLGSLRVRQDVMLAHGLIPHFGGPDGSALAALGDSSVAKEMALARLRQLSAHEVGHAIGFGHNFAPSTYGRASVMDYPAPMVMIRDGVLDLSNAYAVGIGNWDKFAVQWLYSQFAPGADEDAELDAIVRKGLADGMIWVADQHARSVGSPHPLGSLWDNGSDPVAYLEHEFEVRRIALESFGLGSISNGAPVSRLEEVLMPLYLHHRYQLEAAVKSLGGVSFSYPVKTAGVAVPDVLPQVVDPNQQRKALALALQTLDPKFLAIPESVLKLLGPVAPGFGSGTSERFTGRTGATFDPISAATTSVDITLRTLLHPDRAARLVAQHSVDSKNVSLGEVTGALERVSLVVGESSMEGALLRVVRTAVVRQLIMLASESNAEPQVRAVAEGSLRRISRALSVPKGDGVEFDHRGYTERRIRRFLDRSGAEDVPQKTLPTPAGSPIG